MTAVIHQPEPLFSQDWFSKHIPVWEQLVPVLPARDKFLEIGSFEGMSACWLLKNALAESGELFCVDTWQGSPEFIALPAGVVEGSFQCFQKNINLVRGPNQKVRVFRDISVKACAHLIATGHSETFDLIYIDGSHMAYDTLTDACMSWPLLKPTGVMIFDDYLWSLHANLLDRPKMAIDAFTSLFSTQLRTLVCGTQYVIQKGAAV